MRAFLQEAGESLQGLGLTEKQVEHIVRVAIRECDKGGAQEKQTAAWTAEDTHFRQGLSICNLFVINPKGGGPAGGPARRGRDMKIEIVNAEGFFEWVDGTEYVSDAVDQYLADAKEFCVEKERVEVEAYLLDMAAATYGQVKTFAESEMVRRGWYGGSFDENSGGYVFMSQKCFVGARIQRTVVADSLLEAVKQLRHPRC